MGLRVERKVLITNVQATIPDTKGATDLEGHRMEYGGKVDVEVFMGQNGFLNLVPSEPVTRLRFLPDELKGAVEEVLRKTPRDF